MDTKTQTGYSLRSRLTLYFAGVAAMALPWSFLLFVLPWLRARARH